MVKMEIKNNSKYFNGKWYITKGVMSKYGQMFGNILINLVSELKKNAGLDYLLVVKLNYNGSKQIIRFSWEELVDGVVVDHSREFEFETEGSHINDKLYIIDDGKYSTILFPSEY